MLALILQSHPAFAPPPSQDSDLFLISCNEFGLHGFSGRKFRIHWRMMLIPPRCHLGNQFIMPEVQRLKPPPPPQDLRMVRIRFLVVGYYRPHGMNFPVLAEQMIAAHPVRRHVPDPHTETP